MWKHRRYINNILPEKNCYVQVYASGSYKGVSEIYSRPEDESFLRKAIPGEFKRYKLQDPPESRGSGSGNGKCNDYWDPEYKHGPNYICEWWGQAIYSLKCFCLDYEGKDTFVDREEDS